VTNDFNRRSLIAAFLTASLGQSLAQAAGLNKGDPMNYKNKRDVYQTYLSAWSPMTEADRKKAVSDATASEIDYLDASGKLKGHDALASHLAGFQKRKPSCTFSILEFLQHSDVALVTWQMLDPNGGALVKGYDAVKFDATGRITEITGFSEIPAQRLDS